jgi:VCBS repeat-containing protein
MTGDFFHRTHRLLRRTAARGRRAIEQAGRRGDRARAAGPPFICENLEPRLLLSVYAVTNINDSGAGSLRQALLDANANAGLDTITFNIAGGGIHTIAPLSALPDITEAVVIDATSQPGYAGTPVIELNGASAGNNRSGLTLDSGSDGSTIRGLAINRFGGDGIHVTHSSGNLIEYNFIGTDPTGTLAQGNGGDGIEIYFYATNNIIRYNVISANTWGISIGIGSVEDALNLIQANKIGTDVTGTLPLGNTTAGITAGFGSTNTLIGGTGAGEGNIIAFNGIGIELRQNAAGHSFLGNSIFSNGGLGIDLGSNGMTANDTGDGDSGANNGQNFPILTLAQLVSSTQVAIAGALNSTANSYFRVEFFANTAADGSGYGEGQRYLGFVNVATDGTGNAAINVILTAAVAPGEFITATATRSDNTFSTFTDTSEFAQNIIVGVNHAPVLDPTASPALIAVNQDAGAPSGAVGTLVSSLVDFAVPAGQMDNVTDADSGALLGIAVTAADTSYGTWYYSTDGGSTWNVLGPVADNNARLLAADANTRLYFRPNGNYHGTLAAAITFRAWDQTAGSNGTLADTTINGGTAAFSSATDTASLTVHPLVHTPSVTNATTDEDTQTTSGLVISRNAADGAEVTYFKITDITNGTLYQNDGTTPIAEGSFITVAEGNAGLKFTPAANFNGSGYFTVQASTSASDAGLGGGTAVATITVRAVNDAPVLDLDADDSAGRTGADFAATFTQGGPAVGIADADAALSDIDSATLSSLTIVITNLRDGAAESLTADTTGTSITASYNSATGVLTLSGTDTVTHYQQVLRTIRYRNTAQAPDTTARLITFVANDGTRNSNVGTTMVTVVALNNPPVVTDQSFWVAENTAGGTSVGTVAASDPDAGDHLTYSITAGNTGGAFAINSTTGAITVANPAALDYETHPTFTLTVEVTDSGTPARTASATVTIHLADRNEAPTAIDLSPGRVNENTDTRSGTSVGTLSTTDPDAGDTGTYRIIGGADQAHFRVGGAAGDELILTDGILDYETQSSYQVTVRVTDSGGLSQERTFTVTVNDLNEAPVINNQSLRVDENVANGTAVGTVLASDADAGDHLTYAIVAGNTGGAFAIESTTGGITVANRAALDYETNPTFHVTVRVTDTGGLATEATVTISLNGVNEAPLILAPSVLFTQGAVPLVFRSADGTGISITDVDAGAGNIRVEIHITNGGVTLAGTAGLTFVLGDGVDDAILIFTGTMAAVNAALEGMAFKPQPNYVGQATLQLTVDDQGNSGSGGPLLNAGAVHILVGAAPPPPEEPQVPTGPEPEGPADELPDPGIPEPEPQDLSEGVSEPTIPAVPAEEPVVPDAPTVGDVLPQQDTRGDVTPAREPVRPAETPKETRSDESGTPPAEGDTSGEPAPQPQERGQDPTDLKAASAALAESVHANTTMWSQVESMKGQMDRAAGIQHRQQAIAVGMATGMSMSFAAGYVIWLLRGGSLLASLLAATPLWKSFDPLPVLAFWEKRKKQRRPAEKDKSNGDDEHELDELFGVARGATPEGSWRVKG